jgi:hypothetical protein
MKNATAEPLPVKTAGYSPVIRKIRRRRLQPIPVLTEFGLFGNKIELQILAYAAYSSPLADMKI